MSLCVHGAKRELRDVWWCEDCGAVNLATASEPSPAEWIPPTRDRRGPGDIWSARMKLARETVRREIRESSPAGAHEDDTGFDAPIPERRP